MSDFLSKTVQSWVTGIKNAAKSHFNNPDWSLFYAIDHGAMIDPQVTTEAMDLTEMVQKTLYSYIIPYSWKLANPRVGAFIA
jgi:hypothetical protein